MKILISPAKSINESASFPSLIYTEPQFAKETKKLVSILKKWSVADFQKIMKLSPALATLNFERYQHWVQPDGSSEKHVPAIFAFTGEVYKGISIETMDSEHYSVLNDKLRILSGIYGLLRPFDWMHPYRLEMGTRADFAGNKNLYEFWGDRILKQLNLEEKELVFNLASEEYFKAARLKELKAQVITPVFKENKNGDLKIVMMYAKHQRGQFARFLVENPDLSLEEYKLYAKDGYLYSEEHSTEQEWIFVR